MWVCGQWFGADLVERIIATVTAEPKISRRALSKQVCDWLDWRDPLGKPREMSARKALVELERRGAVVLPTASSVPNFKSEAAKAKHGQLLLKGNGFRTGQMLTGLVVLLEMKW